MSSRHSITFTVPPDMHRLVERVRKSEQRTTTELMREALRQYFVRVGALPTYTPTPAEVRAIERGREAFRRGDFVTLDELNASLNRQHNRTSAKGTRRRTKARSGSLARRAS